MSWHNSFLNPDSLLFLQSILETNTELSQLPSNSHTIPKLYRRGLNQNIFTSPSFLLPSQTHTASQTMGIVALNVATPLLTTHSTNANGAKKLREAIVCSCFPFSELPCGFEAVSVESLLVNTITQQTHKEWRTWERQLCVFAFPFLNCLVDVWNVERLLVNTLTQQSIGENHTKELLCIVSPLFGSFLQPDMRWR